MAKKLKIDNKKRKEKWNILGAAPGELEKALFLGPRIELFSNSQLILEGCLGIFEYNDNYLKLRLSRGALIINGQNFDVVSFEEKTITVKGEISSLEFCV